MPAAARDEVLSFEKYEATGNDFVLIDGRRGFRFDAPTFARLACHRHFGIGADGLILLEMSDRADYRMVYYNADGSRSVCGNGIRCVALHLWRLGLLGSHAHGFVLETDQEVKKVKVLAGGGAVRVEMGSPVYEGEHIPVKEKGRHVERMLEVGGRKVTFTAVGMGNPHAVLFVDDVAGADVSGIGGAMERHPFFPEGTNVEFVELQGASHAKVRTWERGVGETLCCATGGCAVFAAGRVLGKLSSDVTLSFRGGQLQLSGAPDHEGVSVTGPARHVFSGTLETARLFQGNSTREWEAV